MAQDRVAALLRDVVRELRRQVAQVAASGQGLGWPAVGSSLTLLQAISGRPGVTVNELARLTGIPKSRASVLLTRLAAQRVVRKDNDDYDSRLVRLYLTADGRRYAREWQAASQQAIRTLLEPLSDAELETVAVGLTALARAFGQAERRCQQEPTRGVLPC